MRPNTFHTILLLGILLMSGCDLEEAPYSTVPEVRIVFPSSSSQNRDSVYILVEASDDRGIAKVVLYLDGVPAPKGTLFYEPYEYYWNVQGLPDSSLHTVKAVAYDTDSNATSSPSVSFVTYRFAPSEFAALIVTDTLLRFTWKDNASTETGYRLLGQVNDSEYTVWKHLPPNTTSADLEGIFLPTLRFQFFVEAVNGTMKSKPSNSQVITVSLQPPSGLFIQSLSDSLIELRWQAGTNSFSDSVQIEQRTGNGAYKYIGTAPKGVRSILVPGPFYVGTSYSFRGRGFSRYTISPYSNVVTTNLTPFKSPGFITVTPLSPTSVRLSWPDSSKIQKGFSIERSVYGETAFAEAARTGAQELQWTDTGLDTTKVYQYRIRAFTDYNQTPYSSTTTIGWFPTYSVVRDIAQGSSRVTAVKANDAGDLIVSAQANGAVNAYALSTGALRYTLPTGSGGTYALALSADGTLLAAGDGGGTLDIRNGADGGAVRSIPAHTGAVTAIDIDAGASAVVSAGSDGTVKRWNLASGALLNQYVGHTDTVQAVRFRPDGASLVTSGRDASVRAWNTGAATPMWSRTLPALRIGALAYNGSGDRVAVGQTLTFGNPIVLLNAATGDTVSFFNRLSNSAVGLAFDPLHDRLVACSDDGSLMTFHTKVYFLYSLRSSGAAPVTSMDLVPARSQLVTGHANGTVTVWSIVNAWKQF